MAVELVTGYSGEAHVTSSQDGARQAGTVGAGKYVLETGGMLAATLENANTVSVAGGDVMMNGRHVHLSGATAFAVPVGAQGRNTSNLLVLRYSVADDGAEKVEALTLTGEPSDGEPADPPLAEGSVLDGDSPVDMALYRVVTTGIETAEPVRLFETVAPVAKVAESVASKADRSHKHSAADITSGTLAVARGGTGAADAAAARKSLGVTPANIGAAASSHSHTAANVTDMKDVVTKRGTSGGWFYRIWKSGFKECFLRVSKNGGIDWASAGGGYYGTIRGPAAFPIAFTSWRALAATPCADYSVTNSKASFSAYETGLSASLKGHGEINLFKWTDDNSGRYAVGIYVYGV